LPGHTESRPRRSTTPAPGRIRSAPRVRAPYPTPAAPAPDATFVIAHGVVPRVWTQTAAAQPQPAKHAANPLQCSRRSPVDERVKARHDCRCGRIDPACPARTVRHIRLSGANAPARENRQESKKHAFSHPETILSPTKHRIPPTRAMPPLATISQALATTSHALATPSHAQPRPRSSSASP
jgi:hypothetical protein